MSISTRRRPDADPTPDGRRHCDRGGSFTTPLVSTRGQRIGHAHAGDHLFGRDLGERHQHEGALEQPRMRQRQVRLFQER